MGKLGGPRRHQHYDGGLPVKLQEGPGSLIGPSPKCAYQGGHILSSGILHPEVVRHRSCERNRHTSTSFLFSPLHTCQEKRQVAPYHRPVGAQHSSGGSHIQNGNGGGHLPFHLGDSLGLLHRHRGRLFPRTNGLEFSQIPRLQAQRKNICVPVPPIRSIVGSMGVLSGHQAHKTPPTHSSDTNLQLPRRFYRLRSVSGGTARCLRRGSRPSSSSGVQNQLGEVQSRTLPVDRISRGHLGPAEGGIVRSPGQTGRAQNPLFRDVSEECHHQERVGKPDGLNELCRDLRSSGKTAPASRSDVVESQHPPLHQGRACLPGWEGQGAAEHLDESGFPGPTSSDARSSTVSHPDDGCLLGGLVRDTSASEGDGSLARERFPFLHELERTEGDSAGSGGLPVSAQGTDGALVVGQHDCGFLPTTSRLRETRTPSFPDDGNSGVLQEPVDCLTPRTPEGSSQRFSGPRLPSASHRHGMVAGQGDIRLDLRTGPSFPGRLVCNEGKLPARALCVPVPGRPRGGFRRVQLELESLDVHIPDAPHELLSGDSVTPPGVPGDRSSGSSLLALEGVVPAASAALQREPPSPSEGSRVDPDDFEGFGDPQQPLLLATSRLAALTDPWVKQGLSVDSVKVIHHTHRVKTQSQYLGVWKKFLEFLSLNRIPHNEVSVYVVMNFLSHQFIQLGRAYRTVAAYKCAIAHPLWTNFGIPLTDTSLELYMRGVFNLDPPRPAPMPTWSLDTLLTFLASEHFEPLHSKSLLPVTQKTLCLLLLASGRRIDEIAHLSKFHVFRRDGESVTVHWLPRYVPKHFTRSFQPIFPSFERMASDSESDLLLCPVRAFNTYLGMIRGGPRYSINARLWSLDNRGLTGMFKSTVLQARHHAGISELVSIGPHHMRKLAASYSAKMIGSSVAGERMLMDRMGCASMNVLKRNYIKDVPDLSFKVVLPTGTFIPIENIVD